MKSHKEPSAKKILSYLKRANVVAENSPDAQTKVGAILVSRSTSSVISEGYNGFIRGADDEKLPKVRPAKYEFIIHAEENLIANAARNGVRTDDCFAVVSISPCVKCARLLFQAGIEEVYFGEMYDDTKRMVKLGDLKLNITFVDPFYKMLIEPNVEEQPIRDEESNEQA